MKAVVPRRSIAGAVVTLSALAILNTSAVAATAPDYNRYCRTKHPNSTVRTLATRWGLKRVCRQVNAGGFTNQGIDLGEACRLTTGSAAHIKRGGRVVCTGKKKQNTARGAGSAPNLARYCRRNYPNSRYRRLLTRHGARHVCRQPGVRGFTNHPIDLARACRQSTGQHGYRKIGNRIVCGPVIASRPIRTRPTQISRRPRYSAACHRVCGAQPSAGARAWCFRHFALCRRR